MHIGVAVFGTHGDIDPMCAVADALRAGGHVVSFFVNPTFAPSLRHRVDVYPRNPMSIVAVGGRWSVASTLRDSTSMDPRFVWRDVYMPQVKPFFEAVASLHESKPLDALVAHSWTLGAQLAGLQLDIPFGCVSLQPMMWMSRERPPRLNALKLPRWLRGMAFRSVLPWLYRLYFAPHLRKAAATVGVDLARRGDLPFGMFWAGAKCHLGLWDPTFRAPQPDDPPRSHVIGFPNGAQEAVLPPELHEFCSTHRPWVMGLGSALPAQYQEPYQRILEATNGPIVLVGARLENLDIPKDRYVRVVAHAPYSALFGVSRGVIHHGGVGTTAEALRAGVPQCIMAFGNDMFDNAELVEQLGVGTLCDAGAVSDKELRVQLKRIAQAPVCARARDVRDALIQPDVVCARAVEIIEDAFGP